MKHTTIKTAFAALIAATALSSTVSVDDAHAKYKVKDMKFHIVQGAYEDYPVFEMKYQSGAWKWVNQNKTFKPRLKVYFKANKQSAASVFLSQTGVKLWQTPTNYATKKYEKLTSLSIGKATLSAYKNQAAAVCDVFGKNQKVVRDINLQIKFDVWFAKQPTHKYKNGNLPIKIVCQAKPDGPTRNQQTSSSELQKDKMRLTKLKLYTIPKNPKCKEKFRLVAQFHTSKVGKVDFTLFRGDGAKQNASVKTKRVSSGYAKRWSKEYKFNESTQRKYMIVVKGHKASTNWVPIKIWCDPAGGLSG